jgi:hypothetical protein
MYARMDEPAGMPVGPLVQELIRRLQEEVGDKMLELQDEQRQ